MYSKSLHRLRQLYKYKKHYHQYDYMTFTSKKTLLLHIYQYNIYQAITTHLQKMCSHPPKHTGSLRILLLFEERKTAKT